MNKSEQEFHVSRILFVVVDGKFKHAMHDKRGHKQWLKETYNVSDEEFENIIRGYIKGNSVFFYTSSDFDKIDTNKLDRDTLQHIHMLCLEYPKVDNPICYNGVIVGKVGEEWKPIEQIGTLKDLIAQKTKTLNVGEIIL